MAKQDFGEKFLRKAQDEQIGWLADGDAKQLEEELNKRYQENIDSLSFDDMEELDNSLKTDKGLLKILSQNVELWSGKKALDVIKETIEKHSEGNSVMDTDAVQQYQAEVTNISQDRIEQFNAKLTKVKSLYGRWDRVDGFQRKQKLHTKLLSELEELNQIAGGTSQDVKNILSHVQKGTALSPQAAKRLGVEFTSVIDNDIPSLGGIDYHPGTKTFEVKESEDQVTRERQAIKRILLRPSQDFDYFGKDENLKGQKKDLRKLKRLLLGASIRIRGGFGKENIDEVFYHTRLAYNAGYDITKRRDWEEYLDQVDLTTRFKSEKRELKKLAEFGKFYKDFRENSDGSYMNRVFQLWESYIPEHGTQAVEKRRDASLFTDMYNENLTGEVERLDGVAPEERSAIYLDMVKNNADPLQAFVTMLADYNLDGKVKHEDGDLRSGLSLVHAYDNALARSEVFAGQQLEKTERKKMIERNIIEVIQRMAPSYYITPNDSDLQFMNSLQRVASIDDMIGLLQNNPTDRIKAIQSIFSKAAIEPQMLLEYGPNASLELTKAWQEAKEQEESLLSPELISYVHDHVDSEIDKLGFEIGELEREHVKTQLSAAIQNAMISEGLTGGAALALKQQIIKGFHLNVSGGAMVSDQVDPHLGISLSYDKKLGGGFKFNSSAGLTSRDATVLAFVPFVNQTLAKERVSQNKKGTLSTNKVKSVHTYTIGAKGRVLWLGAAPITTVGVFADWQRDKIAGIERNYHNVKNKIQNLSEQLVLIPSDDPNRLDKIKALLEDTDTTTSGTEKELSWKDDPEALELAAQNILRGLTYMGDIKTQEQQMFAADRLANYYAGVWKNAAIDQVRAGVKGVSVGLDWVVGTAVFIPSLAATYEWFGSPYYKDTQESLSMIDEADQQGVGNRVFKELENGKELTQLGSTGIDQINQSLVNMNPNLSHHKELMIQTDGDLLKIPLDLAHRYNVNLRLDKDFMQGLVYYEKGKQGESDMLYVPRGIVFRLFDYLKTGNRSGGLDIGTNKGTNTINMLSYPDKESFGTTGLLSSATDLDGFREQSQAILETERSLLTQESVYESFEQALTSNNIDVDSLAVSYEAKTALATISLNDQLFEGISMNQDIQITIDNVEEQISIQNREGAISNPSIYVIQKNLSVEHRSESSENMDLSGDLAISESEKRDILTAAGEIEKGNPKLFVDFMEALVQRTGSTEIAYQALQKMLESKPVSAVDLYIKKIEAETDRDKQHLMKAYLVRKMAVVMAQDPDYIIKYNTLGDILKKRVYSFDQVILPQHSHIEGLSKFDSQRFRTHVHHAAGLHQAVKGKENIVQEKRRVIKNAIGYSAFYRKGAYGDQNRSHGFAMAPMGDLSYYEGMLKNDLSVDDQNIITAFIIDNLNNSSEEMSIFSSSLLNHLNTLLAKTDKSSLEVDELSSDVIVALLEGNSVSIDGIGTIAVDMSAFAYGQAECFGNEGFGLSLNKIILNGTEEMIITETGEPEFISRSVVGAGNLYINDQASRAEAHKYSRTLTLGVSGIIRKQSPKAPTPPEKEPGEPETNPGEEKTPGEIETNPGEEKTSGEPETNPGEEDNTVGEIETNPGETTSTQDGGSADTDTGSTESGSEYDDTGSNTEKPADTPAE